MATENVNQSGAGAAADSARDETATPNESTGPDTAAVEPLAAADTNQTAQSDETATHPAPEQQTGDAEPSGAQDFSAMLDSYEKESAASRQEGEIVRGIVVGITEQSVLVDIGYKSEGVVAREEFVDRQGN